LPEELKPLENFTPVTALAGGLLIGIAASLMLLVYGRIAGISGILGGILFPLRGETLWRVLFLCGLIAGAAVYPLITGTAVQWTTQTGSFGMIVAGLLVGFGTRMGSGCTSGHAICGLARISKRSFAATGVFMLTALITVYVLRHLTGLDI